jgi:hypothetical protein
LFAARVSMLVLLPLFFNYYLLVLLFSAERLKFSLALFILATFFVGVARYALLIVSVLAHAQTVILFLVLQAYRVRLAFRSFFAGIVGVDSFAIFAALAGLLAVFGLMSGHILQKLAIYYELWGGVGGMLKPAVFAFLAVLYAERKLEAFIASSCVVLLAFFLGSERLTIFSYFIFMYYALQYNRGLNIAVIATSIFFAIKGFLFLQVALEYGDGFYGVAS